MEGRGDVRLPRLVDYEYERHERLSFEQRVPRRSNLPPSKRHEPPLQVDGRDGRWRASGDDFVDQAAGGGRRLPGHRQRPSANHCHTRYVYWRTTRIDRMHAGKPAVQ